jgi:hypothetical protein
MLYSRNPEFEKPKRHKDGVGGMLWQAALHFSLVIPGR